MDLMNEILSSSSQAQPGPSLSVSTPISSIPAPLRHPGPMPGPSCDPHQPPVAPPPPATSTPHVWAPGAGGTPVAAARYLPAAAASRQSTSAALGYHHGPLPQQPNPAAVQQPTIQMMQARYEAASAYGGPGGMHARAGGLATRVKSEAGPPSYPGSATSRQQGMGPTGEMMPGHLMEHDGTRLMQGLVGRRAHHRQSSQPIGMMDYGPPPMGYMGEQTASLQRSGSGGKLGQQEQQMMMHQNSGGDMMMMIGNSRSSSMQQQQRQQMAYSQYNRAGPQQPPLPGIPPHCSQSSMQQQQQQRGFAGPLGIPQHHHQPAPPYGQQQHMPEMQMMKGAPAMTSRISASRGPPNQNPYSSALMPQQHLSSGFDPVRGMMVPPHQQHNQQQPPLVDSTGTPDADIFNWQTSFDTDFLNPGGDPSSSSSRGYNAPPGTSYGDGGQPNAIDPRTGFGSGTAGSSAGAARGGSLDFLTNPTSFLSRVHEDGYNRRQQMMQIAMATGQ